jgi:hypothetical protein
MGCSMSSDEAEGLGEVNGDVCAENELELDDSAGDCGGVE